MSRVIAEEVREHGVRVTTVIAGAIDTPIWDQRPQFDRAKMMQAPHLARLVVQTVCHPGIAVDELVVVPPGGTL